ncbi:MAG: tyrosine-type recombinase/integrase [Bellilinea sp.]
MSDLALSSPQVQVVPSSSRQADFRRWLEDNGASARTISAYLSDIGRFGTWFAQVNRQPLTPDLVTSYDLRAYREYALEVEKISAATWNRRRISLARFCRWGMLAGNLSYNPFQGIEPMAEAELAPRWLNRPDQGRIMRQVERQVNGATTDHWRWQAARDQAMVALMRYCGLRVGELVALDVGDITIGERGGRVLIRRGKGDKRRQIPLNAEARRAVSYWLSVRGGSGEGGEPVFIGKGTARLTTRTVERRVAEISRQAGLEITPHQLRHTFCKSLVDAATPVTTVQGLAGHARTETTKRYILPGWDDLAAAVEKII